MRSVPFDVEKFDSKENLKLETPQRCVLLRMLLARGTCWKWVTVNRAEMCCRIRKAGVFCRLWEIPNQRTVLLGTPREKESKGKPEGSTRPGLLLFCCYCVSLFSIRGSRAPAGFNMAETRAQAMHVRGKKKNCSCTVDKRRGRGCCRAPKGGSWRSGCLVRNALKRVRGVASTTCQRGLIRAGVCCGSGNSEAERGGCL